MKTMSQLSTANVLLPSDIKGNCHESPGKGSRKESTGCVFDPNRTTIYLRAERKEKLGERASLLTQMSQHTQMRKILPWPTFVSAPSSSLAAHY